MRRLWMPLACSALGAGLALAVPAPASAAVVVSPAQARQGGAVDLTFHVVEDRAGTYTTKVEVRLPEAAPIAEVYPLSDAEWAPRISYRTLELPVKGGHSGSTSTVTSAVTWFRAPGARTDTDLRVAMAPMPRVGRLAFTVVQTYADGTVRRWPAGSAGGPVLALTPAAAQAAPASRSAGDASTAPARGGSALGTYLILGVVLGLLIGLVVGVVRRRRRGAPLEEGPLEEAPLEGSPTEEDPAAPSRVP
ncbi:MAG TPA: DUF1775 domain-containing protein [Kineosporiaceae bacterium]|nr:DUF1775 domain-containing protein [Kineosporiaceae bacterium]